MREASPIVTSRPSAPVTMRGSAATGLATSATRRPNARRRNMVAVLLGEDELVEAGEAKAVSLIAMTNLHFPFSLEQFLTVDLTVSYVDFARTRRSCSRSRRTRRMFCHFDLF